MHAPHTVHKHQYSSPDMKTSNEMPVFILQTLHRTAAEVSLNASENIQQHSDTLSPQRNAVKAVSANH